ncbi:MAG: efflux RND transporter permease subunit, partial [Gemmatimonadales bacterium]
DLAEAVFKRRLEQLDGVALSAITGDPEREIHVEVDADLVASHDVSLAEVTSALDAANYSAPGGSVRRGRFRFSLRTLGEFRRVEDLSNVVIARPEHGGVVRLRDVARIFEGEAERETVARFNGEPAIGILVYKESSSNTVRVASAVDDVLAQLRAEFPEVTIEVASSQATFISDAISNVVSALVIGGFLAFLVLFLFLRDPRYPVAIGLSIPISVLAAFTLCYLFDVSLNVMSLGGLGLGVGMLVDNSIVVLENIFRHREEAKLGAIESSATGAREVAAAITASTLTTIAVFGPVLYVEGVAGALFADLSLAVAFSLLASLLVALTLIPVLAARIAGPVAAQAAAPGVDALPAIVRSSRIRRVLGFIGGLPKLLGRSLRFVGHSIRLSFADLWQVAGRSLKRITGPGLDAFDAGFAKFAAMYDRSLGWALEHRSVVLGGTGGALALAVLLGATLPRGMMPDVDEGSFRVELTLPVGTPLEETASVAERIETGLLGLDGVEAVFSRVGRARDAELATRELSGLNSAALDVRLESGVQEREVISRFRALIPGLGVSPETVSVERGRTTSLGRALAAGGADLAVRIRGQELDSLIAVAELVAARMTGIARVSDPRIDVQLVQPELDIEVDRDAAARYGFTVREVADAIESYLRGVETTRPYTEFSEKIDIRVSLPADQRSRLSDVLALTHMGIPIGELVRVSEGYGPVEIRRLDQNRTVQVLADVHSGGLNLAVADVQRAIADVPLPSLTAMTVGGENEEMRDSFRSLLFAFGLALFLVFLILAAQFESLIQPIVVLTAVPLAAIGAVLALWLLGSGINAMSGIGLVILIGIVVNDAIIKVDFINQRRSAGATKRVAILEAGRLRLRPIIMTTVTTVLGLTPMALGWGAGADLRAPLAIAVIGGLISATLLTLIVVPVIYSLLVSPGESVSVFGAPGEQGLRGRTPEPEGAL